MIDVRPASTINKLLECIKKADGKLKTYALLKAQEKCLVKGSIYIRPVSTIDTLSENIKKQTATTYDLLQA